MKQFIKDKAPWLVMAFQLGRLCFRELRWFPNNVLLHNGLTKIFANPFEYRGRLILLNKGKGQPYIKKSWETAVKVLKPDAVVDCGANYGEVMYNCAYPEETKLILGLEANPKLQSYLQRTRQQHPDSKKIEVVNGLASDKESQHVRFFLDQTSSGRSTVMESNFVKAPEEIKIPAYRVDDLVLAHTNQLNKLVFKIDVEGYEETVLRGMTNILTSDVTKIGCIEFNTLFLRMNEISLEKYFNFLFETFDVVAYLSKSNQITPCSLEQFNKDFIADGKDIEIDLLLFGNRETYDVFVREFELN